MSFALSAFRVFFAESVGLSLDEDGKLMGVAGIISATLFYPIGALADRWRQVPMRVMRLGLVILVVDLPVSLARNLYMILFVLHISAQVFFHVGLTPLYVQMLPRDRYGQFCSAANLVTAAVMVVAGLVSGAWLDWLLEPIHDFFGVALG